MAAHPGSLPKPSLTFSVPSVHDGLALDCRVYHPPSLAASLRPDTPPWHKHAAVVAHPYAPLGGCYDDPIVDIVSATLLRLGFLVVTFNFRFASTVHRHKLIWSDLMSAVFQRRPRLGWQDVMDGQGRARRLHVRCRLCLALRALPRPVPAAHEQACEREP